MPQILLTSRFLLRDADFGYQIDFDSQSDFVTVRRWPLETVQEKRLDDVRYHFNPKLRGRSARDYKPCLTHCQRLIDFWDTLLASPEPPKPKVAEGTEDGKRRAKPKQTRFKMLGPKK